MRSSRVRVLRLVCVFAAAGGLLGASGCAEWRAERALKRAVAEVDKRATGDTRKDLRKIVERWPETKAAARAREEIEWLDDLDESSHRGRGLLAWDAVRRVARAVERYRTTNRRYPERFDDLVPRFLAGAVRDPWGQAIGYRRTASGYQTICYGADGIPGGHGEATDILVENGREIHTRGR